MTVSASHPDASFLLGQATQPVEEAAAWLDRFIEWFRGVPITVWLLVIAILIGLIIVRRIWTSIRREIRRRRPATIHPALQKYNVDRAEVQRKQREIAVQIEATSTGSRLAGYRIVRQVEAVFVEGYNTPEEALIALKAEAAERGANAILNVKTDRTVTGRCSASGDAIVVAPLAQPRTRPSEPSGPGRVH